MEYKMGSLMLVFLGGVFVLCSSEIVDVPDPLETTFEAAFQGK